MDNFLSFEQMGTFGGMVLACTVIVQVLKQYINVSPRWLNLIVSAILTAGVQILYKGDLGVQGIFLAVLNWIAVTGAAGGAFDYLIQPVQKYVGGKE